MAVCPNCGAFNNDGSKFCTSCGGAIPAAQPAPQAAAQPAPQAAPQASVEIPNPQNQYWQQPAQQQPVPVQQPQAIPIVPAQPVYAQPITQPIQNKVKVKSNGFCTAGLVLSIIGLCTIGSTSLFGLIFSIIGLISASKKNQPGKGKAIAGIIISAIIVLGLGLTYAMAWNDIKDGFESGRISSPMDFIDVVDESSDRNSTDYQKVVKSITDESWIETNSGSYLVFEKGKNFKYYQSYADTSDYYYTGKYKLYIGQDAVNQITKNYKEYGVTESEIKDTISRSSRYKLSNFVFLVLENDGQWIGGKNLKDEEWETPYFGFLVKSSGQTVLDIANMNTAEYYTFVPEDDYDKTNTPVTTAATTEDEPVVTTEATTEAATEATTEATTAGTTADPNAETFGDSITGTVTLTQGSWGVWNDADLSGDKYDGTAGRINLKTGTIINLCVFKQTYNDSSVKAVANALKNSAESQNSNADLKEITFGGYNAYEMSTRYSDGTNLSIFLFLDGNSKLHYITIEYKDSDVASYEMLKSTYKFN